MNGAMAAAEVARLILNAEPGLNDARGWADDLLSGLSENELPQTRENVCAAIAIVDQESSFKANPPVPGLGKLAEKSITQKLGGYPIIGGEILRALETNPKPQASFMDRIRAAKTERDLDLVYRDMVAAAAEKAKLGVVLKIGLLNGLIEERNDISTVGSMQVAVAFAIAEERKGRWTDLSLKEIYELRDTLYTRKGGLQYGMRQLLGYETGYAKKIYRFADYNAGRYSSRNAAFQEAVATVTGANLALDGDLLVYDKSRPRKTPGQTEKALRVLPLKPEQIRADLLKEKSKDFDRTETFRLVREAYRAKTGKDAPFARVPEILLSSVKIKRRMTTGDFAASVDKRYRRCMAFKLS
jgi:hypothetical protein